MNAAPVPTKLFKSTRTLVEFPLTTKLVSTEPQTKSPTVRLLKALRSKPKTNGANKAAMQRPKKQQGRFNTAVWLSFNQPPTAPIALILSYKDSKGEFSIVVDDVKPAGSSSLMLSGNVTLNYHGDLEYLKASCTGFNLADDFTIEDAHIKKIADEA
ncbi:hypothetical protein [Litoribacillus peritrichatus]|uniref:Uncharacterized protein n=1 Tax=Litoribacillus peritrichatus TaxID=718191 RepID=A0ABP7M8B9_9GAMM